MLQRQRGRGIVTGTRNQDHHTHRQLMSWQMQTGTIVDVMMNSEVIEIKTSFVNYERAEK